MLNIASKTIIAHSVAQYDAVHPVPRPIESDCKAAPGELPNAPDNVVMCATHGHVLDTAKKQIIANSGVVYLRAHPEHAPQPKPKPKPTPPPPQPAADGSKKDETIKEANWKVLIDEWKDLRYIVISAEAKGHTLHYSVTWEHADTPTVFPPPLASALFTFAEPKCQ